jgi:aminoglycoside 6'-N-acetyltransferase I
MIVRQIASRDRPEWLRMRMALWPGSLADHEAETSAHFDRPDRTIQVFVAEENGRLVGFLEIEQRKYAPGCRASPVPFIEGWWVDPEVRRNGIGRALVRAAEEWARAAGFEEIASDVEIDNRDSIAAHGALGYTEIERVVFFRKALT